MRGTRTAIGLLAVAAGVAFVATAGGQFVRAADSDAPPSTAAIRVGPAIGSLPSPGSTAQSFRPTGLDPVTHAPHAPSVRPTSPRPLPHPPDVPPAKPEWITIPAIGVDTTVGSVVSQHVNGMWTIKPPESTMGDLEQTYWWSEHAAPGAPSTGTTYIYGHACTRVSCAFNDLHRLHRGEVVWIRTAQGLLHYRVLAEPMKLAKTPAGIGSSSIYEYGVANRLVLITCGYAPDGSSPFNWAVITKLAGARRIG